MTDHVFHNEVVTALSESLSELTANLETPPALKAEDLAASLSQPPQFDLGQAAVPCHPLAKTLKTSPAVIAQKLAAVINEKTKGGRYRFIAEVRAVNGYLNFHCKFESYAAELIPAIRGGTFFNPAPVAAPEKILVEYSQPNTHKMLHVGHLRNMVYGDAVCNLLAYSGHDIVRATYPGDLGTHIAKTVWYIKTHKAAELPAENQADWLGKMYCEADDYVSSAEGKPEEALIRSQIGEVLYDLQHKRGDSYALYLETREWSLAEMRRIYDWLGIHFDTWYYESECDDPSRELVQKKFEEGFFVKSEGAVGIDLSQFNLGFALFLKSDGTGLYLTKDLELIRRKFSDPAVTRSIVVVDSRQKLHFKQLFKTAELMGYPQAAKSEHLSYETVTTEDGRPFSSRSLTGMPLHELRSVMERKVVTDYLQGYKGEWPDAEIEKTAEQVAQGALKYGFLRVDGNSVIRFVLNDWLRLDGETGPYLQYVHARCASVVKKLGNAPAQVSIFLETDIEKELLYFLGRFNHFAFLAAASHRPSVVAAYLYDLCKLFNRFYTDCPIKTSTGTQRDTRLALVDTTAAVLKRGLQLLGIPAPERM